MLPLSKQTAPVVFSCLLAVLLAACGGSRPATSPHADDPDVLALIGGEPLRLAEFEDRYARSVGGAEEAADDSLAAYRDFLDRYVDFRLKVMEARAAGLEQDSSLQAEIRQYRTNLSRPYMLEQEVIDPVVRELYEKRQTIVDASHILLMVAPEASASDTLAAYRRMETVIDSIEAGMPFERAAIQFSEDPSARSNGPGAGGHLGYFSAGDMVDEFEQMAYTTPVGALSPIFRTRFGYHILQVNERTTAPQERRVAHIMIRPDGSTPAQLDSARAEAETLRQRALDGEDFAALAAAHSDDAGSAARGGELGVLTWQTNVVEPFKSTALSLDEEGVLSDVVETSFGFHVIKVLEVMPRPTYEEAYNDLKSTASRLPRAQQAQEQFAREILNNRTATADTSLVLSALAGAPYDSLASRYRTGTLDEALLGRTVATIGSRSYTVGEMMTALASRRPAIENEPRAQAAAMLDAFLLEEAIEVEAMELESKDAEFARIMNEFQDGLLLFRLMEDSVWQAAQQDSLGLLAYYEANRDAYQYPERTRIISLTAPHDTLLLAVQSALGGGQTFESIAETMLNDSAYAAIRVDTVMITGPTNTIYDRALPLSEREFVGPLPHRGNTRILLYHAGIEAPRAKTFTEARAEVTTAYQEQLDAELKARLRARYGVRTFPERLTQAFDQARSGSAGGASTPGTR